jgi:hypothetical protein
LPTSKLIFTSSGNYAWIGASGKEYNYTAHPLSIAFKGEVKGNYIFARHLEEGWLPIYIGEGDLSRRPTEDGDKMDCIKRKGATHIHIHLNPLEEDRKDEEADLLRNYPESYAPRGCNKKEGG